MIKLKLISPNKENDECRCYGCNKLLAKIKTVESLAIIEIKCTRAKCGIINRFEIERNIDYVDPTRNKNTGS